MNLVKPLTYVKQLLTEKPHLRDSDDKLVANFWHKELALMNIEPKDITAFELLQYFADGKLTKPESIMRVRRKLQEEFYELRGKLWAERHGEQEKVKEQLYQTPEFYKGGTP